MFYIVLYRENMKKIFLSETLSPRALIFGMQHHLVDLYQVCSNYAPGEDHGPPRGHIFYKGLDGENKKFFLSETTRPRALF